MKEYLENRLVVLEVEQQKAMEAYNVSFSHFDQVSNSIDIDKIQSAISEVEMILKHYLEGSI